jgi:RecJ-like exonuclease
MFVGAVGSQNVSKDIFGVVERFSTYSAVVFTGILGIYGFNVNEIVAKMIENVPQAGVDGGGHECAGSIKYIEGLGQEVLYKVVEEIQSLSRKG